MGLANTDADSTVPPNWLTGMVEHAAQGADLVLGTVRPGPGIAPQVERGWPARHNAGENHPHIHGANFGIRADAYVALDGRPEVSTGGEDVVLASIAASVGSPRIRRTSTIPVRTGSRPPGRAPRGFSSNLRGLTAAPPNPESQPDTAAWPYAAGEVRYG